MPLCCKIARVSKRTVFKQFAEALSIIVGFFFKSEKKKTKTAKAQTKYLLMEVKKNVQCTINSLESATENAPKHKLSLWKRRLEASR